VWLVSIGTTADNSSSLSREWMMQVSHHNFERLFQSSMSPDRVELHHRAKPKVLNTTDYKTPQNLN
jgi:hypothetical protein